MAQYQAGYRPPIEPARRYKPPYPKKPYIAHPKIHSTLVRDYNGNIVLNKVKRYLRPYWLQTEPEVVALPSRLINPQRSADIIMPVDNQGPVEIYYSMFEADGDFMLTIFDPESRRVLMNREVHIRTVAGTAQAPLIWKEPLVIYGGTDAKYLYVTFRNLETFTNNVRFSLHGRRLWFYESPKDVIDAWEEYLYTRRFTAPYFLTTASDITTLNGVLDTPEAFIRNPDGTDFEWFKSAAIVRNNEGNPKRDYEIRIIEQANTRPMMNDFILDTMVFGDDSLSPFPTGLLPFNLWESMYFERNYKFRLELRELDVDSQSYFITLIGRQISHER